MPSRIYPLLLTSLVIILSACSSGSPSQPQTNNDSQANQAQNQDLSNETKEISAILVVNDGQEAKQYPGQISAGKTVFDFTKKICEENGLDFQYQDSEFGAFIEKIGAMKNDNAAGKYWTFKLNGEPVNVGAGAQTVNEGDNVEWSYGGFTN